MAMITATEARRRLYQLLDEVAASHEPVQITGRRGNALLRDDRFQRLPPFEKLVGDVRGAYSRCLNIQHRLVVEVVPDARTVKVLRMWTHDE